MDCSLTSCTHPDHSLVDANEGNKEQKQEQQRAPAVAHSVDSLPPVRLLGVRMMDSLESARRARSLDGLPAQKMTTPVGTSNGRRVTTTSSAKTLRVASMENHWADEDGTPMAKRPRLASSLFRDSPVDDDQSMASSTGRGGGSRRNGGFRILRQASSILQQHRGSNSALSAATNSTWWSKEATGEASTTADLSSPVSSPWGVSPNVFQLMTAGPSASLSVANDFLIDSPLSNAKPPAVPIDINECKCPGCVQARLMLAACASRRLVAAALNEGKKDEKEDEDGVEENEEDEEGETDEGEEEEQHEEDDDDGEEPKLAPPIPLAPTTSLESNGDEDKKDDDEDEEEEGEQPGPCICCPTRDTLC
ncbi:unnamed protein product, partial [Mesorhabditis spiculigera]